jgi:hypothetical protein
MAGRLGLLGEGGADVAAAVYRVIIYI